MAEQASSIPLKETKIDLTINNKPVFLKTPLSFEEQQQILETQVPHRSNDYFDLVDLNKHVETDTSSVFTVDVQPDFRFPTNYIANRTVRSFSDRNIKPYPQVSLFSSIAFQQLQLNALILLNDIHKRKTPTFVSKPWRTNAKRRQYLNKLMESSVSTELIDLIDKFCPIKDSRRPDMEFIPSLSALVFNHDFGRLCPPILFLIGHVIMSSTRTNVSVSETIRRFHNTPVVTVDNVVYYVSHFIGGYYAHNQGTHLHDNWIYQLYASIVNPAVTRAHLQRQTLVHYEFTQQNYTPLTFNSYDFMLNFNTDDFTTMMDLVSSHDEFQKTEMNATIPLRALLEKYTGPHIICHTIEPITLPTWHQLAAPNAPIENPPTHATHRNFATLTNFMVTNENFNNTILYPANAATIVPELYLVSATAHVEANRPFNFEPFDPDRHVYPNVLTSQPYESSHSRATISMILGLKIEQNGIDGITIPIPNPNLSAYVNNSHYLQGTIPVTNIKPTICNNVALNAVRAIPRVINPVVNQPLGFAIRDMSTVVLPNFDNTGINVPLHPLYGFNVERHFDDNRYAYTQAAWLHTEEPPIPDASVYLWSSYRHISDPTSIDATVSFYCSLNALYGINAPVSRIANPQTIIPNP